MGWFSALYLKLLVSPLWLFVLLGCQGKISGSRSSSAEDGGQPKSDNSTMSQNATPRINDEGEGMPGYQSAQAPVPITGTNLVEVQVFTRCVTGSTPACLSVRLGANIKVGSATPIRFAVDTKESLGVTRSFWEFRNLPDGVSCVSTEGNSVFNPLCSGGASLSDKPILAVLKLIANDGTVFEGESPKNPPTDDGGIRGNFMLLGATPGLTPSGIKYAGASGAFTQVWQDLVTGLLLTNVLYNGDHTPQTNFSKSKSLCGEVNSGDGVIKWRLPTVLELCGFGYTSNHCDGGIFADDISNVENLVECSAHHHMWSSSAVSGGAWAANLSFGTVYSIADGNISNAVICVR